MMGSIMVRARHLGKYSKRLSDGQLIEGCDVSHFQGDIDWSQVADIPKYFTYVKATDGTTYTDDHFAANFSGARAAGVLRGAYHFFRHGVSGSDQANFFLDVAKPKKGDLPPALDLEDPPAEQAVADYLTEAAAWVTNVSATLNGQMPVIYVSPSFWTNTLGAPDQFANNPLWIAHYTTHDPTVPKPWGRYTFWQYTNVGSASGISSTVDLDRFQGSMADLNNLVLTSPTLRSTRSRAKLGRRHRSN